MLGPLPLSAGYPGRGAGQFDLRPETRLWQPSPLPPLPVVRARRLVADGLGPALFFLVPPLRCLVRFGIAQRPHADAGTQARLHRLRMTPALSAADRSFQPGSLEESRFQPHLA